MTAGRILSGDNLPHLKKMAAESVALVYIDPPFNTGKTQSRKRFKMTQAADGEREGFGGKKYRAEVVGESGYADSFSDFAGFLRPRIAEAHRILKPDGSLFFHIDWREAHRCRILLEEIFGGAEHCINEIIWAYDFGARSKSRWSAKHDNIYWFAKNPKKYVFNYIAIDRIPYIAPGLVGEEKAARGKTPTDVWWNNKDVRWNTIVSTNGREKTGYPTQKPLAILERIVRMHSYPGDTVLDFFAGSGTTGEAAAKHGRKYVLMDENLEAVRVMKERMSRLKTSEEKISQDYQIFSSISEDMEVDSGFPYETKWKKSKFRWILDLPPPKKGSAGKVLASRFLSHHGFRVNSKIGKDSDFSVNGRKIAVKFSTLWNAGVYKFQQIRKQDYDILLCLGISPRDVHSWVVRESDIDWDDMAHQHGGSRGSDTWWISFPPPYCPHTWMRPQNGDLSDMLRELKKLTED